MADNYSAQSPHLLHRQHSCSSTLAKDDVGRARPSCRDLPPEYHSYGISEPWSPHGEGVRDALVWSSHVPSAPRPSEVDFKRLNKAAATHHVTTPKKLSQFRATQGDFPRLQGRSRMAPAIIPSDVIPDFAYGQPGRPSTPLGSVIANQSGNDAEDALDERYRRYEEVKAAQNSPLKFKMTKAERLRRRVNQAKANMQPEDPSELWQMSKFRKVPPQLRQAAPLYRDEEGRLRRCESPALKSSISLPSLPQAKEVPEQMDAEDILTLTTDKLNPQAGLTEAETEDDGHSESSFSPACESEEETEASPDMPLALETKASIRTQTKMTLFFTVQHAVQEELDLVASALTRRLRMNFPDSVLKVQEYVVEPPRHGLRQKRQRYAAWGQAALKTSGPEATSLSPLKLSLAVTHNSDEELREIAGRIGDCILYYFPESGPVRLRKMSPSLWLPPAPPSPPKSAPRDGLGRKMIQIPVA